MMTDIERAAYDLTVIGTFQLDPVVEITLKGKTYRLEFNNRSVKELLKRFQFNVFKEAISREQMEDPEFIGVLLWLALQTNHPDLTVEETDLLFTSRHYPYVINRLQTAMDLFLPDMTGMELEKPEPVEADSGDADPT